MAKAATKETKNTAIVEIPLADPLDAGFCVRHVNVNLDHDQRVMMRRIVDGLDAAGAKLANGRRVVNPPTAVQWMIEQVKA